MHNSVKILIIFFLAKKAEKNPFRKTLYEYFLLEITNVHQRAATLMIDFFCIQLSL